MKMFARKKPIIIDVMQLKENNVVRVYQWINSGSFRNATMIYDPTVKGNSLILIKTLEGIMTAHIGDYVIKGVSGEFYPVKKDIFEQTYEICGKVIKEVEMND